MKLRNLFLLASLTLPAVAHATPFDTTITGGGYTIFFPNVGGPSNYTIFTRVNEVVAEPLYVYINGGPKTQGGLDFYYAGSGPTYLDLIVKIPTSAGPLQLIDLYGPNLIGGVDPSGSGGFYSSPGTYNLTDAFGNPYTYVVTPQTPAAPEIDPSLATTGLALLAGGIAVLRGRRVCRAS